ncbi:hypothetical protein ACQUEQ_11970 [Enterococcus casseliflavus]|uniref:hypothetical protein n=1 Tax=Enterococcus casseliflavus TaxID=37734 RepID=UPI003D0E4EF5
MANKVVKIQMQGKEPEVIEVEDFNLKSDYYDYVVGSVKDPHGNLIQGVMIGDKRYVRIIDVVDIRVEDVPEEEEVIANGTDQED